VIGKLLPFKADNQSHRGLDHDRSRHHHRHILVPRLKHEPHLAFVHFNRRVPSAGPSAEQSGKPPLKPALFHPLVRPGIAYPRFGALAYGLLGHDGSQIG
jgi:hypothetical protein